MNISIFVIVIVTMCSAIGIFAATTWLETPPQLRELLRSTVPPIACFSAAIALDLWHRISRRQEVSKETDTIADFIGYVMDIEQDWHQPLEISGRAVALAQGLFDAVLRETNRHAGEMSDDRKTLFLVSERIVEISLRTTDSLLSLLRAGHPDTAMGVVRTLFELQIDFQIICLDSTGRRAARYREFREGELLQNLQDVPDGLSREENLKRLTELKVNYDFKKKFPSNSCGWIIREDGKSLDGSGMAVKIDFLLMESGFPDEPLKSGLGRTWVRLNQWAHGTPLTSYWRIAARNEQGYLIWKRGDGLNTPMLAAIIALKEIMTTYVQLADEFAEPIFRDQLDALNRLISEIQEEFSKITPGLINNDMQTVRKPRRVDSE